LTIELPWLSTCPRVRKCNGRLIAVTAWRLRIMTLGCMYRKVIVDPKKEEVVIARRYFWAFARRRRIKFAGIAAITYGYQDLAANSWSWAHDSVDLFSVGLRLHSGDERHLFHFYGDGTFENDGPWPDWLYWDDYLFDTSGTQQRESKAFVDLLSKMIRVPVIPGRN